MPKLRAELGRVVGAGGAWVVCCLLLATFLLSGCNGTGPARTTGGAASATSTGGASGNTGAPSVSVSPGDKSADVTWTPPTTTVGGSPLTNLAGYHVYYGTNPYYLTQKVDVPNAAAVNYVITGLPPGTWYFAVEAYTNTGLESCLSIIQGETIT